jgi:undecaprenyl-diphosphatase
LDNTVVQALIMGIVQGLTEFLPISSSGHLIIVPFLFGWDDPFIESLAFSVMLHFGTLAALLIYFGRDWVRIVPAGFATIRDRSFRDDPDRKLAWLLLAASIPAAIAGLLFNDIIETTVRSIGLVAVMLVVGAAQALALVPGISRSGISISAARFAGLDRQAAARFSFLMATPITLGAALFELRKLASGETGVDVNTGPLIAGMLAAFISGMLAIKVLLGYLRVHSLDVFVVYRLVLAALILVVWLAR